MFDRLNRGTGVKRVRFYEFVSCGYRSFCLRTVLSGLFSSGYIAHCNRMRHVATAIEINFIVDHSVLEKW